MPGTDRGGDPGVSKVGQVSDLVELKNLYLRESLSICDLPNRRAETFYGIFVFFFHKGDKGT